MNAENDIKVHLVRSTLKNEYRFDSNLAEFREHYPEYADDLVENGRTGGAIGQGLWFQAHIINEND